ncbi:mitogen-activated protein kinase kinase kinase 18-like [Cucurbita maxima]|uniref:Mitogen-activated protein kinase kinase kinase 18-like n=1 Tax=Cucurbita maxima TaxID=3661 RepID=A0A6J1JDQ6_CUCMA|nr:mitogen-activated protein kinase kinase kinase 18-like [Cucurbita maxima]
MDWTRRHVIGHGSSATVFLATDSPSGDVFAVKSAEISHSQSLQTEQQFLSSLASPYVVSYKGYEVRREQSGVVMFNLFMEYLPNGSLADVIRRRGGRRLDEAAIGIYTRQLLQGLQYIHSKGLVHCDIKSRNVLIGRDGEAKLADFGCAKWASQTDSIGGTPLFMAPEVARGEHQGLPSDIWSIGCSVIEMATGGGSPWPKTTSDSDPISALYRIGYSGESPEIPSFLSHKAKDFLEKCLRMNPNERWTANQLLNHPFVREFNSSPKKIHEVHSNSPTSILEQGVWRSIEESEIREAKSCRPNSWAAEQIRRLWMASGEPSWRDDETWITIRRQDIGKSKEVGDEGDTIGGSEVKGCSNNCWGEKQRGGGGKEWSETEFTQNNGGFSCRISRNDLADHRCKNIISLVHNNNNNNNNNNPLPFHTHTPKFLHLMATIL